MSDYRAVLDSFNKSDIDEVVARLTQHPQMLTLDELLEHARESMKEVMPWLTDGYSFLRYYLYLLRQNLVPVSPRNPVSDEVHDMDDASLLEADNVVFLNEGGSTSELLNRARTVVHQVVALMSMLAADVSASAETLLGLIGKSPYIDTLVRHSLQMTLGSLEVENLIRLLRNHLASASPESDLVRFVFELSAENDLDILPAEELGEYLAIHKLSKENLCALLRLIGSRNDSGFLESLHQLVAQPALDMSVTYTLIDVIAQIGNSESIKILNTLGGSVSPTLAEFIEISVGEIESAADAMQKESDGLTLVQCAFYGDLTKPGVSSAGGLSTFLFELGNHLTDQEEVEHVYTLNLLPVSSGLSEPLLEKLHSGHTLIRIPVAFDITDESVDFLRNEFEIMHAVGRTLERYGIDPDIFHIRYTDNASRAVLKLAKKLGKKVVFTLTPDPHATFVGTEGNYRAMEEAELLRNLNKVFIADTLVDEVDGLLLIGYEGRNTQVLPYFPQLLLDEQTKEKPLTIAAEGVCFESCQIDTSDTLITLNTLTSHGGKFCIDSSLVNRPVILNVGRLHPLKGQHNLVEAWAESSLNEFYNLVLIGGNLAEPNGVELSVIQQIDETMRRNPDLTGRFSHVPALPNQEVRFLEQAIVSRNRDEFPNVYLSSSYKEEFGISILEAMTAGFLVLAPTRGGVSDYIEHGVNGFLVSTDDAESIRASMEAVLHAPEKTASLHEIALRGERLAQEKLSITRIGKDYLEHYLQLTSQP